MEEKRKTTSKKKAIDINETNKKDKESVHRKNEEEKIEIKAKNKPGWMNIKDVEANLLSQKNNMTKQATAKQRRKQAH